MIRFVVIQTVIVVLSVVIGWKWVVESNVRPAMPELNVKPRSVKPLFDYPFVVSNEQLAVVLEKMHPSFSAEPTKINFIDHALRMWGATVQFDDGSYSGSEMCAFLLDHNAFAKKWGASAPPLLLTETDGICVLTQAGQGSVSHVDHLIGTIAEIGLKSTHRIGTERGVGTVRDLLQYGFRNFRLNQKEYEWTVLAAAFYAKDGQAWYSNERQQITYDALAERMMRQEMPLGVCYGQHRLYSLVMMLRIDDQMRLDSGESGLLSRTMRKAVEEFLFDMTKRFYRNQSIAGYWDGNWADVSRHVPDPSTDALSRRILATGHALEWWAMAPEELHPPRETIVRAAQWLAKQIIEMDKSMVEKNYTFLTHAARALALWRGQFPAAIHESYRSE